MSAAEKRQNAMALFGFMAIIVLGPMMGLGIIIFALGTLVVGLLLNVYHSISPSNLVRIFTLLQFPALPSLHTRHDTPSNHTEYSNIIFELQQQLAQVTQDRRSLTRALAEQQGLTEDIKARYTGVNTKLIRMIEDQRREFEHALQQSDSALKKAKIAYGRASNSEYGAHIEIQRLRESINKDADKAAIQSLKNQVEDLNKQLAKTASEKDAVAADPRTQLAKAQSERDIAVQKLQSEQSPASQKKMEDVESLNAQIKKLQSEKDSLSDEADSRFQAMELEKEREKKKMIKEASDYYHHLIGQINQLKSENTQLKSLVNEVISASAGLQSANASTESQNDALKATNNELTSLNSTLTLHLSVAENLINAFMQGGGAADQARDYVFNKLKGSSTTPEEPNQPPSTDSTSIPSVPPTDASSDPAAPGPSGSNPPSAPEGPRREINPNQDVFSKTLEKKLTCHKCGQKGHQYPTCPQLLKCLVCREVRGDFTHTIPWCQAQPGREKLYVSLDDVKLENQDIVEEYERANPGLKEASMGARPIKDGKGKGKVL